ncbi:UDP-glucuronosyl/UDP-glucosyltransferase [Macleaya cordata]|uniref:Glycosyltransferase n=1 Tax=Macleaya cordata TaxID=56857 RepID=A0A200QAX0_MACCD|nr:UDP-glucuronosyl/UDP-glucosyltransferase [Macleaya cordata]
MSKGHTIPILHLVRLLLRRNIAVTIFTTNANSPFIRQSLAGTEASIVNLSFPENVDPQLPPGVESTDTLPSMSLFIPFVNAAKLMQSEFDRVLESLPSVSCMISDGFLPWTLQSALKLGIPRLVSYGMSNYAMAVSRVVSRERPHADLNSDDEPFTIETFPWIKLTKNDFEYPFNDPNPKGPHFDFILEAVMATANSKGIIVNSFYELEPKYLDYLNRDAAPKAWCVGPLCLAEPPKVQPLQKPIWVQWLDEMLAKGRSVLYVAFGSQAEITREQLQEIEVGLEHSEANFLWVIRSKRKEFEDGFEERVRGRGLVVREWVDQMEILSHESVNGFMSHCGWNSVMESICADVPILAWPMMAEQHLNARMVVEELGIGVRVLAKKGSVRGFVSAECIENKVRELIEGEKGKEVRKKVKEVGEAARMAMEEGGSSWRTLDLLIEEVCGKK